MLGKSTDDRGSKLTAEIEGSPEEILRAVSQHPCLRKATLSVAVPDGRPAKLEWYTLPEIVPENLNDIQTSIGHISRRLGQENVSVVQKFVDDTARLVEASGRKRQLNLQRLAKYRLGDSAEAWLEGEWGWNNLPRREAARECHAFEILVLELENTDR